MSKMRFEEIEDAVWYENYGSVHDMIEDPEHEGPLYATDVKDLPKEEQGAWQVRTDHGPWTGMTLCFFVCPGPHSALYRKIDSP